MTPEERQMLAGLFERVNANGAAPRDAQAEAFINDAVRAAPFAPYVLAQTVLVQQHALEAAAQRVAELEAAAHEAASSNRSRGASSATSASRYSAEERLRRRRAPAMIPTPISAGPAAAGSRTTPLPPPPQYAPPQPGPWGGGALAGAAGGGFLQNAASTAAGVAGGVALGNLLGGLFGGHRGGGLFGGGFGGAGFPGGGDETINNFYEAGAGRLRTSSSRARLTTRAISRSTILGGGFDDVSRAGAAPCGGRREARRWRSGFAVCIVPAVAQGLEAHRARVDQQKAADEAGVAVAKSADNFADRLERHQRAENAAQWRQARRLPRRSGSSPARAGRETGIGRSGSARPSAPAS